MEAAEETVRRRLLRLLAEVEHDFDELLEMLGLSPRELEAHLRHAERSVRRRDRRLMVTAPTCLACGFGFPGRESRHLHPPGRCPKCRSERIAPPRFRVADDSECS